MKTDTKKSLAGLICAALLILIAELLPLPEGITRTGLLSFAVFFGAILMWILNSLPMCITALLMIFLMPALGIQDLNTVFTSFGGSSFFFAIATFAVSIALEKTSVPLRICHVLTKWSKGNPKHLVIGMCLACGLTSAVMSNLSTCIIYLNLGLALLSANQCKPGSSNLGKCLMIGLPCCAGVGGLITPAGTPGNLLIIDLLQTVNISMSFMQWCLIFAPLALICILIGAFWLTRLFAPEEITPEAMKSLEQKLAESGTLKTYEKKTILIILAMLICWFLGTWVSVLNVTVVAVVGMALLFFPGIQVLDWDSTVKKINWNLCFTIGSVGVLIGGMTATGIMDWIVEKLFAGITSWNLFAMFFVIGLVVCVLRAFIPTAPAIVALFGAPLLSLTALTGATPTALLAIPAFWACAPMLLWIEPIYLFSYGYNYYTPKDLLKYGTVPSLSMVALMSFLPFYVGLFGL
ncbi:hypothetical protein B5F53_08905 [Blautia sp. An249]|uniref:SLC13 family permease n=1 Tax=Blautia sp. An249 TaxID=1965603 RepID=UPI000B37339B|nr:SLC13 family permease [Blautia sp. An249]OUO78789.1 hypothetical protein B5F53_08905 [Blautia sp. An249]